MHKITMTYTEESPHFGKREASVTVERDGSIEHFADTFEAFLVACGYTEQTAGTLVDEIFDDGSEPTVQ